MVEEAFANFGLFIDDQNKIRVIDPERVSDSAELRDECKDFVESTFADCLDEELPASIVVDVVEFKKIVDTLIERTEQYAKQVESARLKVAIPIQPFVSTTIRPAFLVSVDRSEEHVEISWQISGIRKATSAVLDPREND